MTRHRPFDAPATITVRGRGFFPLDMLRHSQCWPVGGHVDGIRDYNRAPVEIELHTSSWRGVSHERWSSFGWKVISVREHHEVAA